jgi:hypothetical protein
MFEMGQPYTLGQETVLHRIQNKSVNSVSKHHTLKNYGEHGDKTPHTLNFGIRLK